MSNDRIIVGYDGSQGAKAALRWALDEGATHRFAVHLVYVLERPLRSVPVPPMLGEVHAAGQCEHALSTLDRAVTEATSATRVNVEITSAVLDGPPATVLCEQSEGSRMLVLGHRAKGGLSGLFIGSVSQAVATHARCPVVVVRHGAPTQTNGRPVAVGVDESAQAQYAIGFAIDEAATRGVGLVAVRAWTPAHLPWRMDVRPLLFDVAELETAERHVLTEALNGWRDKYPGVAVSTRLISSDARHALAAVSRDAQLLVVGSRGHGGFEGLLLGSVSHYLLHHAACPVAITRELAPS